MDYNQIITTEVPKILTKIVSMVDRFSEDYKIKDIKIEIDDSDVADLGSYVATGSTCDFTVVVKYLLEGETEYRETYISIPRMISGIFIIDGKYKMLSRYIGEDHACRWWGKWFRIKYGFSFDPETNLFTYYDEDGDQVEATYDEIKDNVPELLVLDNHQSAKLKIKLNLQEFPHTLTKGIVEKLTSIDRSTTDIIDKRIISIESTITSALRWNTMSIVRELTHNFYKYGTISSTPFEQVIRGAFNGQNSVNTIINSTNVNPLSFDSTNGKIIIEHSEGDENLMPGQYSESMADIIDPVVTPDNANINRINHLTKAADVSGQYIAIHCYDKNFKPVEIDYVTYLASVILKSSEVDYQNKKVISNSPYNVKINRVDAQSKNFDYIEPAPDDRLSVEARMIPMLNLVDSVRGSMGAKMVTQAVPLCNPEAPRVQSGYESDNSLSTTDIKYNSSKPGEVISVTPTSVIIVTDGVPHEYKVPTPAVGIYNITAVFAPTVKEGQKVKSGDTIISHDISKTGTRDLGCNALVALRPYRGYNYEDGVVISESFAKKLSHYSIIDLTLRVKDNESILALLPIGTKVKSKDVLVSCATDFKNKVVGGLIEMMNPSDKLLLKHNDLITPNNIDNGIVTDVKIQYNDYQATFYGNEINTLDPDSITLIENFKATKVNLPDSIPSSYRAQLPGEVDYEGYAACIRYRILTYSPAIVGSKVCNRYGSKGLVALVVPDEEMDRTEDGREIDVILNSDAVIARKNIAQIPEVYLSVIADRVKVLCQDALNEKINLSRIKDICKKYKLTNYSSLNDTAFTAAVKSPTKWVYITGCFSRISPKEVLEWSEELQVSPLTRIIDGKTKRKVRNPILVGDMYMMKLYQLPEHYNKVFTEENTGDPILGKGLHRDEAGMAQGALESFSLMASDLQPYMEATRRKTKFKDAQGILINMRLAGVDLEVKE